MSKRGRIYVTLAAVLLAGCLIVIAAKIYRPPAQNVSPDGNIKSETGEKIDTLTTPVETDSAAPAATQADSSPPREASYSNIMKLLKASKSEQIFGSYQVKGIILNTADPESSSATIEDLSSNISRVYSLGDTLPDESRLVDIKLDHVVLQKNGVRERIYIQLARSIRGGKRSPASGTNSTGFQKINDNEYNLNPYRAFRGDADKVLDFTMKVSSRDGRMEGIQVSNIGDNSLARKLGLQENDILLSVNRESVDSILKSIYACVNAYNSDDVQLEILRGGKVIFLNYHLFWEGQGSWTTSDVLSSKAVSSLLRNGFISNLF